MTTFADLEQRIRARGVRVELRLRILAILQRPDGAERLAAKLDEHEHAIERAARKVRAVVR
jgi:hypothetical protein